MQIEDGKFYITRNGRLAGPARSNASLGLSGGCAFTVPLAGQPATYHQCGARWWPGEKNAEDLVCEWFYSGALSELIATAQAVCADVEHFIGDDADAITVNAGDLRALFRAALEIKV